MQLDATKSIKILCAILVTAWCQHALCEDFSRKLSTYECQSEESAAECKKCTRIPSAFIDFAVSKRSDAVFLRSFEGRELIGTRLIKYCLVVNKENWICEEKTSDKLSSEVSKRSMTFGIYSSKSEQRSHVSSARFGSYICAK